MTYSFIPIVMFFLRKQWAAPPKRISTMVDWPWLLAKVGAINVLAGHGYVLLFCPCRVLPNPPLPEGLGFPSSTPPMPAHEFSISPVPCLWLSSAGPGRRLPTSPKHRPTGLLPSADVGSSSPASRFPSLRGSFACWLHLLRQRTLN
jgi:hypothetical protein